MYQVLVENATFNAILVHHAIKMAQANALLITAMINMLLIAIILVLHVQQLAKDVKLALMLMPL